MAPAGKTGRGGKVELPGSASTSPLTLSALRAQHLASRFGLPIKHAAIIAALAFGGGPHG